jgi:hypothetical protein
MNYKSTIRHIKSAWRSIANPSDKPILEMGSMVRHVYGVTEQISKGIAHKNLPRTLGQKGFLDDYAIARDIIVRKAPFMEQVSALSTLRARQGMIMGGIAGYQMGSDRDRGAPPPSLSRIVGYTVAGALGGRYLAGSLTRSKYTALYNKMRKDAVPLLRKADASFKRNFDPKRYQGALRRQTASNIWAKR